MTGQGLESWGITPERHGWIGGRGSHHQSPVPR